jgi:hypothetical protein
VKTLSTAPASKSLSVAVTADEILETVNTLGSLVAALVPGSAAVVAAASGAVFLIERLVARLRRMGSVHLTIAAQALLKARSDANRLAVGARPSPGE